ncbi:glycosyltransferase [Neobacillus drentensis]|uniref:glycosyltransferase n=1 Tax=Neobacillus drentensis TaxID=220684 RepID=UPI00300347E0
MKRVLFMVGSMNIGGVEKSLLSLLSVLPKGKFDITILLLEKKGVFLEYIPDWVNVKEVKWFRNVMPIIMQPPNQTVKGYLNFRQWFKIPSFIFSYLLSKKFNDRYYYYKEVFKDVPYNTNLYDIAISYAGPTDIIDFYIANKVKATKKISWVHFDVSKHLINEKLYKKIYNVFDKVFVVSKEAKKRLIEKVPTVENKAEIFNNIISFDLINKMSAENVYFDERFKGTKILTVGRLSKEKGQDLAIKALAKLLKEGYEVRWYCVGDGNDRKIYEKLIEEYNLKSDFILLGSTPNPYPYIANADIYVQTSRHEGYCLTIAEAKCLKKTIVTTNFIGAYEQIVDGETGFIVECNEETLYRKIKYLIDNKEECIKVSQNLSKDKIDTTEEVQKLINYIM